MFSLFNAKPAMHRMLKARATLVKKVPFFAGAVFNAKLLESKSHQSIWTDGRSIYFNPDWVDDPANDQFIEAGVMKATLHCMLLHTARRDWRSKEQWNEACSYATFPVVGEVFPLPIDAKVNPAWKDLAAEAIYSRMPPPPPQPQGGGQGKGGGKGQQQQQKGQGGGKGDKDEDQDQQAGGQEPLGGMQEPDQGEGMSPQEAEDNQRDWESATQMAAERAKKAGTMPGFMKRIVEELLPHDKLDWRDLIRDMARDAKAKNSRTWARPNRRRLGGGEYMPGYGNDNVYKLVVCLDTSGSVSSTQHNEMRTECAKLLDEQIVTHVVMLSVDTRVADELEATTAEAIRAWRPKGGGGTDFNSAMKYVSTVQDAIGCVFLTDMETSSFGTSPGIPTVWVNWTPGNQAKAPYGRTVPY